MALNSATPFALPNISNQLAASSSLSLPWLFEEIDQPTALKFHSSSSFFSLGNQSPLAAHNWVLVLCGSVPCELPREAVCDALAMSVGSHSIAPCFGVRDYRSDNCHVHDWALLQMGTT